MLDKIWKRISEKKPAGKKLIPIVLGLSGAMWLGAAATFLYLKDKPTGGAAEAGHGGAEHARAGLEGVPAAHAEAAEEHGEGGHAQDGHSGAAHPHGGHSGAAHPQAGHSGTGHSAAPHGGAETSQHEGEAAAEGHGAPAAHEAEAEGHAAAGAGGENGALPTREEMAALRQVAELRVAAGQAGEAVDPLRRILTVPTGDARLLSLAAGVFLGTGNYAEAYRYAQQALVLDPGDMATRVRMVEAQYRMGETEKAEHAAKAALKEHPGHLDMLVELGAMQVEMGPGREGYGQALAEALKLRPDYVPALYLQGRKAQLEGDYKDAEIAFAKVVKRDPSHAKALGQLGIAQYQLGKTREAEGSFRGALARNPGDYNTWYNLGELLLGHANDETSSEAVRLFRAEAMECYLKAIEGNPEHAQARYRVGVLLIGNGQYKEAIRHLEAALRLDSRHVPTLVQLSLAYENLKQPERARAYLNKAYELDPLNKLVLFKLRRMS